MADYDGWQLIEPPLGEGGQGKVYKARNPNRVELVRDSARKLELALTLVNGNRPMGFDDLAKFAKLVIAVGKPDEPKDLGALKIFKIPGDGPERDKAYARLNAEVEALTGISHPAVLKLLHHNRQQDFIITEYHPLGTLDGHLNRSKGRGLDALLAFRPLVEAVSLIHARHAVHRDIKPKNIFIASDGHLVLGDFGIALFRDSSGERMTETYESQQVGSRDWMAPWANTHRRLTFEEINATLDIYPLGKVLWCMVSGQPTLDLWYFDRRAKGPRPSNNLEDLFPSDPSMHVVNEIISKCVVEEEDDCLKSADELLALVNEEIAKLQSPGLRLHGVPWTCGVCGKGHYMPQGPSIQVEQPGAARAFFRVHVCDNVDCHHVELIWKEPTRS